MGGDPVHELLGHQRLGVHEVRSAHGGDEQFGLVRHLPRSGVVNGDVLAREVDEELLARLVPLAHDDVDAALPGLVVHGELGVGVPVGEVLFVLEP